ncbi:MAG TPA: glutamyl-tRNA reductase [Planctomycetota bacterium]|nr:glutamyl-tRNA reductase [Planctomycetota bacterium]
MSTLPLHHALRVIGLSHHKAPVSLRERLAFRADALPKALAGVLAQGFHEAVILSTCNRVEIYAVAREGGDPGARIRAFLAEFHSVPEHEFAPALYDHAGADAIRHLFEVTASLDSQVLGETEILAQSKDAYRVARENGTCGRVLHAVFERAFFHSKEVRADGGIGRSQASISSAAVTFAQKLFELRNRKVLVIGTGEMATGIVRALKSSGVGELLVASRSEKRAEEFAKQEGGKACYMLHLDEYLAQVDIVLVSSAAPHYLIGPKEIKAVAAKRRSRALCLIDISVPRNVDPAVHEMDDTFLYDIDDLEDLARDGRREREAVAARWRPKSAEEARELLRMLGDSEPRDTAKKLIEHFDAARAEIALDLEKHLDPKSAEAVRRAMERFQGKLLHGPLDTLKQATREGGGADASAWISRLFRLESAAAIGTDARPSDGKNRDRKGAAEPLASSSPPLPESPAPPQPRGQNDSGGEVAFART